MKEDMENDVKNLQAKPGENYRPQKNRGRKSHGFSHTTVRREMFAVITKRGNPD
jgi:hypothetical protein